MGQRIAAGFRTECEAEVWAFGRSQKPEGARALISLRIGSHSLKPRLLGFLALGQNPEVKKTKGNGQSLGVY